MSKTTRQLKAKLKHVQLKKRVLELRLELAQIKAAQPVLSQITDCTAANCSYGVYIDTGLAKGIRFKGNEILDAVASVGKSTGRK